MAPATLQEGWLACWEPWEGAGTALIEFCDTVTCDTCMPFGPEIPNLVYTDIHVCG